MYFPATWRRWNRSRPLLIECWIRAQGANHSHPAPLITGWSQENRMTKALIAIAVLVIIVLIVFGQYVTVKNTLVSKNEAVKAAWSQVDIVLQRRADLIPNLVETVKGYAQQEQTVFGDIAKARSALLSAPTPQEKIAANHQLDGALGRLLLIVFNDQEQAAECSIELVICRDLFLRRGGRKQCGSSFSDVAEHGLFLLRVTLHCLHQIGDQVGAPLQHDIHLRPGCLDGFILADECVLDGNVLPENDQHDDQQRSSPVLPPPGSGKIHPSRRASCGSLCPLLRPAHPALPLDRTLFGGTTRVRPLAFAVGRPGSTP